MLATSAQFVRRLTGSQLAWSPPANEARDRRHEEALRSAYRARRRSIHAERVPLAYTFFLFFAAFCTVLEHAFYPHRRNAMLIALAVYAAGCITTIVLVRRRPEWTTAVTIVSNNVLILCTVAYYVAVRGLPATCALTLVLFMAALPLLNAAGAAVQALSCIIAIFVYPTVIAVAAHSHLPAAYGMTAIVGAVGVTVFGAFLLDRQRYAVFRTEAALRASEESLRGVSERYRALHDHNPAMYFTVDADGRVDSVNRFGAEQLGYGIEELLGQPVSAVFHPDDRNDVIAQLERCARHLGEVAHWEFRKVRKDGSVLWVKEIARAVRDREGKTVVFIVCEDITERRRMEEAARQHQAELAHVARVSLMGEMAAELAHELNQPLGAIVNFTRGCERRLRARDGADADILYTLEQVSAQALRAASIVHRVRDFIRKEEPTLAWVDVNELVRNVTQLADAEARQHGVRLELALSPDIPRIYANAIQIEQVLLNLVHNGLDAMNGTTKSKMLAIGTAAADHESVEVAVSDTGSGLAPEVLERIFEPFFSTKSSGLGVGLSISRSIVEAHGGRLWVEPNANGGTTFRFRLSSDVRCNPDQAGRPKSSVG